MAKVVEIEIPAGKKAEWQEIDGKTVLVAVDEKDNRPVTERIKKFGDAIRELGEDDDLVKEYKALAQCGVSSNTLAFAKLKIIIKALNEGWMPQFVECEKRYYPVFNLYNEMELSAMNKENKKQLWLFGGSSHAGSNCGLASAVSSNGWSYSSSHIAARLILKSPKLAEYCGTQFIDIWADYIFR